MQPEEKDKAFMDQFKCPTGLQGRIVAAEMNRGHSAMSTWGLKKARIEPDFVVLDVGCGGGKTISRLARKAFQGKVFGIDYSADMVQYSREVNRRLIARNQVEILAGLVERMGFPEDFFDLVTAIETYYFWPDLREAFQEIKRVLKPERNLLMINEMVKDGIYEVENADMIAKAHVRLIPLQEIQIMLRSVGFVNVKVFTKTKSPWNAILAQKPSRKLTRAKTGEIK
jgi:ubiquinone/menaquinone biosynthesis C-methylase UbiE